MDKLPELSGSLAGITQGKIVQLIYGLISGLPGVGKTTLASQEPESLISLQEASELTGNSLSPDRLRGYALDGSIPGARQATKGKQWFFKRALFEKWWQNFNALKPGEN
jgi:hypothetical protein